jgi:protein ImuB
MFWVALQPSLEDERAAWSWRALQFTPRVTQVGDALLMEISGSERLFGGRRLLLERLMASGQALEVAHWARAPTSLLALALLKLKQQGRPIPTQLPDGLPLDALEAATRHVATLSRTGCNTWGQLRALPRSGVARRFGGELLDALDCAYGERPESYPWTVVPEVFDMKVELPALATSAPELMWTAQRLLSQLQVWLQARHHGVLGFELEWTLDLKRLDGVNLPMHEQLVIRTAQPTQDMAHLRRLAGENLDRATLCAPVNHLRLRSLETQPWAGASRSFLPEDNVKGDKLHQFVERVSARLGEHNVVVPTTRSDHRPERMQAWVPARGAAPAKERFRSAPVPEALYPTWLLPEPVQLEVHKSQPHLGGPLHRITRPYRVETGWWEGGKPALRDYFIARSEEMGLVWIYRERPLQLARGLEKAKEFDWYLQGLYA